MSSLPLAANDWNFLFSSILLYRQEKKNCHPILLQRSKTYTLRPEGPKEHVKNQLVLAISNGCSQWTCVGWCNGAYTHILIGYRVYRVYAHCFVPLP